MQNLKRMVAVLLVLALLLPAMMQIPSHAAERVAATVVYINPGSIHGFAGEQHELRFSTKFCEELQEPLIWSVLDPSVATVSTMGVVTLVSPGSTTVTASTPKGAYGHCVVTVLDTPELQCGKSVTAEADEYPRCFNFTPDKDGRYSFFASDCSNMDYYAFLCDSNRTVIAEAWEHEGTGHFQLVCDLTAGEQYQLKVRCQKPVAGQSYRLQVQGMSAAEGLAISHESLTVKVRESIDLYAFFQPISSISEKVTWTSSNQSVARIKGSSNSWCSLNFDRCGTATITAATESGLTAACQITVENYPTMSCNTPVIIDPSLGDTMHCFIPEESGWYGFYTTGKGSDTVGILYDANLIEVTREDNGAENDNFMITRELVAGQAYYIKTYCWTFANTVPYELQVAKATPATSMKLSYETVTVYPDSGNYKMVAKFYPMPAIPETVTWSSSDLSVVQLTRANYLWGIEPGTATVTATTKSGLSTSCHVTVEPLPTLPEGEKVPVAYSGETLRFTFTPETDGYYCFFSTDAPVGLTGSIIGPKWVLTEGNGQTDFRCVWNMTAGETYELTAEPFLGASEVSFHLCVMPMMPATELVLDHSYLTGYMGDQIAFQEIFAPLNALDEDITWTSSNEEVALCLGGMVHFRYPGTCVITALSESGLTATCTVVSRQVSQISSGDTLTLDAKEGTVRLRFIPPADGEYRFETQGLTESSGKIKSANGEWLSSIENFEGDLSLSYLLKANNIYYLECDPIIAAEGSYQLSVLLEGGHTLSGTVESTGSEPVKLELLKDGVLIQILNTSDHSYCFQNLAAGSYTLRISALHHVPRDYTVNTGSDSVTLAVKTNLLGDVNGDSRVNIADTARIYSHVKQSTLLTDEYHLACGNVNGGKLDISDVAVLYSHIKGSKKLY